MNMIDVLRFAKTGNPDAMFNSLVNSNPQFRKFVESNKGKSAEQIAKEYNLDYKAISDIIK